ncbi:glutathione S-transferase 1-like [Apostichopus japonicus]|uniref:glutathione S-transferase 1-like n=1 Tax=Stichopus japonicus TaxID=307972 RepID=UPI003AB33E2E
MSQYKLTYFNAKGRGEPARYMFHLAGVDFEDFRIELQDWEEWKPKMQAINPMGKLPILEIDGEIRVFQSNAINRYLARIFGFWGSNAQEQAQIDVIYETLIELLTPLYPIYAEKDEEKKNEMLKKFKDENVEETLKNIETLWESNNKCGDYLVGDKISLADIFFFTYVNDILTRFLPDFNLDGHPKLKALVERVAAKPPIEKWLKERPVTER